MRLKRRKRYNLEFELGPPPLVNDDFLFEPLVMNDEPVLDFSEFDIPNHLTRERLSYFPRPKTSPSLMLDLGCGSGIHRSVCEYAGFEWVGLDFKASQAPILGDAHSLPFKDNSFEFILSIAVLEHIRFPHVMMREAYRVMKPHGSFIGTVAFLEPFHDRSFYHHTHLGTFNSLHFAGFTIEKISPSEKWSVLKAQADMAFFPNMHRYITKSVIFAIQLLQKLWWKASGLSTTKADKLAHLRDTTGAFTFIASKDAV